MNYLNEQACKTAGIDMGNDFIKQMFKLKLVKSNELAILTAVAERINDYVKHETTNQLLEELANDNVIKLVK